VSSAELMPMALALAFGYTYEEAAQNGSKSIELATLIR